LKDHFDPAKYSTLPGVYLMRGEEDVVLYVGKAKNLRARLRNYFSATGDSRPQIRFLVERIRHIETIVTDTEKEALILENTLIKRYRPRYNIHLRDDKTYLSIRLDPREEFPALQVVRKVQRDGALYFGPYSSSLAVRETLKEIHRIFPLRHYPLATCRRRGRPCLFYQIGQCSAPCDGRINHSDYARLVCGAVALLSGKEREVLDMLKGKMVTAANEMRYEEAARLRDQIKSIEETVEKQKVVDPDGEDLDVVGFHREGGEVETSILFIRKGKLIGRRSFPLEWRLDEAELLSSFLQEFYGRDIFIPKRVLLPFLPGDEETLADWLSEKKGKRVEIAAPLRGEKKRLVDMAQRNAVESFRERGAAAEGREKVLEGIRNTLHLSKSPRRMECFDISNVGGALSVGSMAVFTDGGADRQSYRRFRIRTVEGADDYASLREVLLRRLERAKGEDLFPDLILIDGGKGQLAVLSSVLDELGLSGEIDIAGIAKSRVIANMKGKAVEKSEERFFRPGRKNPILLRKGSPELFVLERLRDEAHRFAIEYHRKVRGKASLASRLDEIPGVGPARRKVLLKHFGSMKKIRDASVEELSAVPGISKRVAETINAFFSKG